MIEYPKSREEIAAKPAAARSAVEIRFIDIVLFARKYFKAFLLIALFSGILGIAYSFTRVKRYEARILLLPEYGSSRRSSFSLLASGLGGDGAEKLLPDLYPTVLQSSPFGSFLLKQPVTNQKNQKFKTFDAYLQALHKDKSPGLLSRLFSSGPSEDTVALPKLNYDGILSYSPEEQGQIGSALAVFSSTVDQKSGVIEIAAETEDPFVSAILAESARKYLVDYVEDYRTTKVGQNLTTLKERVEEAKGRLRSSELALQSYRDRNRNNFLNVARIEEQRLQSEFTLSQSIYNDLIGRFEQAKISIRDEKPVFKVLEPAKVPLKKSSPKRLRFGIIGAFLGCVVYLIYILVWKEKVFDYLDVVE